MPQNLRPLIVLLVLGSGCLMAGDDIGASDQSCEFMGESFPDGELFPAGDGCNTCACNPNGDRPGEVECTAIGCAGSDCEQCSPDELCVVNFDGVCNEMRTRCVATACTSQCSPECDAELCGSIYSCDAPDCGPLPENALGCYGP